MVSIWSNDHIDVWHVVACTSLATTMQPAMPAADLLVQLMSPPPHSTQQQYLLYQHSLQLHNSTKQPDTLYHNQCNHRVPPPLLHNLSLQLNNNTSLWDTPSHNQCKHHLPPLRLHNHHPFTLSTHHITTQPCQVFRHLIMSCSWNYKRLQ